MTEKCNNPFLGLLPDLLKTKLKQKKTTSLAQGIRIKDNKLQHSVNSSICFFVTGDKCVLPQKDKLVSIETINSTNVYLSCSLTT